MELKPCPFCDEDTYGYDQWWVDDITYIQRICGCGAKGPTAQTFVDADDRWNTRTQEMK